MKKNLLIWGIAVVLVVVAIFVTNRNQFSNNSNQFAATSALNQSGTELIDSRSREKAADFTLKDLAGNSVSLKNFQGKNIYINFWATWCPWCKKELPDIEKVSKEYKNQNLLVLTVDIGEDYETVSNYMKENNYDFSVLLDSNSNIARQYGVSSIPVSIFIDKGGNIAQKNIGAMTEDQMRSIMNQLLKE